ncbi:MAG: hypothetical protein E6Q90_10310 [Actinobacteria bacterium]|nr:MAG: hypothetical protein E6Q90_10310 [Actinomycetota bacterium]
MGSAADDNGQGVEFPLVDGRRSSTAVGREACAAAADAVSESDAETIRATDDWRSGYLTPFRRLTELAANSPEAALALSSAGLEYLRATMQFDRDGDPVAVADLEMPDQPALQLHRVRGSATPVTQLVVPFEGRRLAGDDLRRQLDTWVSDGIVEPGFRDAIGGVIDNPDWLDTSDTSVVVLGAGAEMGPLRSLLRWGGRVVGVDLRRPELWRRLLATARDGAGTLEVPVPEVAPTSLDDDQVAAQAGADLIAQTPDVARLVAGIEGPLVLGNYAYADGADHVRVSMAADALAVELADRADVMLAYLATPTDAFAVPWRDVEISQGRWDHRRTRLVQPPLHLLGTFKRNYSDTITTSDGTRLGIADCLVPQQGPNYALAKRLQRWRAVVARNAGTRVSLNVAPATRTRSVVKNRLLAAAYAGAHRFGIRVFDPGTANTLMAAMLVHDLRNPDAAANPAVALSNPMDLFSRAANHGGLWTTGYEPRSVLGVAALLGMFESRA